MGAATPATAATSDNIAAIEKALEGVTPGPWYPGHLGTDSTCQCRSIVDDGGYMGAIATVHVDNGLAVGDGGNDAPPAEEAAANMRYIAACNPVAISALLAEARKAEAMEREIAELHEAAKFAIAALETLQGYEADLGDELLDDYEIGRIEDSRHSPSFRIRVGHIRRLARTLLNGGSDAQG